MYDPSSVKLQGVSIGAGVVERWEEPLVMGRQEGASAREVALKLGKMIALGVCQTLHIYFLISEVVACFSVTNRKETKIGTLEVVLVCPYDTHAPTTFTRARTGRTVKGVDKSEDLRGFTSQQRLVLRGVNGAIPTNLSLRVSRSSCFF